MQASQLIIAVLTSLNRNEIVSRIVRAASEGHFLLVASLDPRK
jgi:hypothetical protein